MRIICKTKDYYDYLVGKWGIDNKVIYNRDIKAIVDSDAYKFCDDNYINDVDFSEICFRLGLPKIPYEGEDAKGYKFFSVAELVIGDVLYKYKLTYTQDTNHKIKVHWGPCEKERITDTQREGIENPIYFRFYSVTFYHSFYGFNPVNPYSSKPTAITYPILKGTKFAGLIDPEEAYLNIYSYLSRKNEKDISDNRTNDEKIVCNGFDKKTSFRNIK